MGNINFSCAVGCNLTLGCRNMEHESLPTIPALHLLLLNSMRTNGTRKAYVCNLCIL